MCVSVGVSAGGREKKRVQKNGVLVLSGLYGFKIRGPGKGNDLVGAVVYIIPG